MPSSLYVQRIARKALVTSALATPDVAPAFASVVPAKTLKKRKKLRPHYYSGGLNFLTRKDGPAHYYYSGCTVQLLTRTGTALFGLHSAVLYYSGCTVQLPYYLRIKNNATLLALERGPPLMNYKEAPLLQVAGRIRTRPPNAPLALRIRIRARPPSCS